MLRSFWCVCWGGGQRRTDDSGMDFCISLNCVSFQVLSRLLPPSVHFLSPPTLYNWQGVSPSPVMCSAACSQCSIRRVMAPNLTFCPRRICKIHLNTLCPRQEDSVPCVTWSLFLLNQISRNTVLRQSYSKADPPNLINCHGGLLARAAHLVSFIILFLETSKCLHV